MWLFGEKSSLLPVALNLENLQFWRLQLEASLEVVLRLVSPLLVGSWLRNSPGTPAVTSTPCDAPVRPRHSCEGTQGARRIQIGWRRRAGPGAVSSLPLGAVPVPGGGGGAGTVGMKAGFPVLVGS